LPQLGRTNQLTIAGGGFGKTGLPNDNHSFGALRYRIVEEATTLLPAHFCADRSGTFSNQNSPDGLIGEFLMPVVQTMKCPVDERKIVRVVRATDSKTRTLNRNSERIRTCPAVSPSGEDAMSTSATTKTSNRDAGSPCKRVAHGMMPKFPASA
jgi:hypothetical protein